MARVLIVASERRKMGLVPLKPHFMMMPKSLVVVTAMEDKVATLTHTRIDSLGHFCKTPNFVCFHTHQHSYIITLLSFLELSQMLLYLELGRWDRCERLHGTVTVRAETFLTRS